MAASGRGVAVVSDDPRFDLVSVPIEHEGEPLSIDLFAAWEPSHHAHGLVQGLAERLRTFSLDRYGSSAVARR